MEIGLPHSLDGKLHHAKVKQWVSNEDGRPTGGIHMNQLLDTRQYEDEYKDGSNEVLAANLLAGNIIAQVDECSRRCQITVWQKKQ